LFIQQALTNVPIDAFSNVTNTDTSPIVPTPTYVVKPLNNNRSEKNSQRLYSHVVYCKAVYIDDIYCYETAADAKNVAKLALPCAILILIISTHISIHRMELYTGTNPIKTIYFVCLIPNVSKKLITSKYI
jgi:hypothetical protein